MKSRGHISVCGATPRSLPGAVPEGPEARLSHAASIPYATLPRQKCPGGPCSLADDGSRDDQPT